MSFVAIVLFVYCIHLSIKVRKLEKLLDESGEITESWADACLEAEAKLKLLTK